MTEKKDDDTGGESDSIAGLKSKIAELEETLRKKDQFILAMSGMGMSTAVAATEKEDAASAKEIAWEWFNIFTLKQAAFIQGCVYRVSYKEMAEKMGVSINTVKIHHRAVKNKLGTGDRGRIGAQAEHHLVALGVDGYVDLFGINPDWVVKMDPDETKFVRS